MIVPVAQAICFMPADYAGTRAVGLADIIAKYLPSCSRDM